MNKLISKLLSLFIVFSIFFDVVPISVYANEVSDLKMQGIEGYKLDLQKLNLSIIDNDTDKNSIEVEIKTDKIAEEGITLIFQKGINLSEKNKDNLPKNLYLDFSYEDKGNYGENYTSIKIKQNSKNSIFIDNDNEKNNENKPNELKSEELLEKYEKINLTFDIASNVQKGNLIAATNNEYAIVVDTPEKILEKNDEISKFEEEKVEVSNFGKEKIEKNDIYFDYGYVTFMVQNKQGQLITSQINFELKKEATPGSGKYTTVKTQYSDTSGELNLTGLNLNTNYQLFIKGLGSAAVNYEKPTEPVAEFYFDKNGIHFQEGSTAIFLYPRDGLSFVPFSVRNYDNEPLRGVTLQLKKETTPGSGVYKNITTGQSDSKGVVMFSLLNLGVKYQVVVTNLGPNASKYEMPNEPVVEFCFNKDTGETNYLKGSNNIRILRKGEEKPSLGEDQYYGYMGGDSKIKISKEDGEDEKEAFCFQQDNTFPEYGAQILYVEQTLTPQSLYDLAQKPRVGVNELYDRIRQVIAFAEINKEKLMTEYDLQNINYTLETSKDYGFYSAVQEAIWYYSNSTTETRRYPPGSLMHASFKKAVDYILTESQNIPKNEMDKVKLKIYKTEFVSPTGKGYQALLAYEFDKSITEKFNIQIKKVDNKGNIIINKAIFSLFKQSPHGEKGEAVKENVSTQNGTIEFTDLEKGEYLLYEVKEPEGYEKLTEPYHIKIDENGKITATYKGKEVQGIENDNIIPIVNESKYFVLPDTGGMGIEKIMIAGISFIFIFILLLFKKIKDCKYDLD
ncbi:TPA: Cys-Gln thioester bond-forming surface protein [Clostridium perfringens]|nr:Cys-Gln thioester bond-forming surface protein [Clostridium perfringens]